MTMMPDPRTGTWSCTVDHRDGDGNLIPCPDSPTAPRLDRSHLELAVPEPDPPPDKRAASWGCGAWAVLLSVMLLAAAGATPRNAPVEPAQSGAPPVAPSPAQLERLRVSTVGSGVGVRVESVPTDHLSGAPLMPEVLAGGTTYSGKLAWADPKYGPLYLAVREPRGTLVKVCGPSGCVTRRSTDFGPVRSLWLAGRIADVSAADFLEICGVPLSFGLCPGSVQVLERPRIELPATDLEGP